MFGELLEIIAFFFFLGLIFLVPTIVICVPIWFFGRRRVQWVWLDYIVLIIPFMLWVILICINEADKSLANAAIEPFLLGCSVPIAFIVRLIIGKHVNQRLLAISLLTILCLIAVGLWMFVPGLPE